jgi:pyruvate dehydrogenase E2 component (dihydrolipoamide acetyltransferase)
MAVAIKLPDMGTNVEECKVHAWRVQVGEPVKRGDVLADIETDKAVAELESTAEGVLLKQVVAAGVMATTGDVLAYVGQKGEAIPDASAAIAAKSAAAPAATTAATTTVGASPVRVSPMVKNLAAKMGIDLATVRGTGVGGMITREDVLNAKNPVASAIAAPAASGTSEQPSRGQAAVARIVTQSWKETPHIFISMAIEMSAAIKLRGKKDEQRARPSFDAIFLKALATAIESFPIFASRWENERIVKNSGIHIAFAVSAGDDLLLPVVRDVNKKSLEAMQTEIAALAASVRAGTLKPEQMTGACMAISNLGMYPVESFEGIIFPGHSSILTIGTTRDTPVAVDGRVEIRPMANATLAVDHRLINGKGAAEFLTKVKQVLESGNLV